VTPLLFLGVSVAGGIGAALRLLIDGLVRSGTKGNYPAGTTIINVSGSFVLGLVTGLAVGGQLPEGWQLVIGTGLLGGYTTFSTASFETVRLIQDRRYVAGLANGLGMLFGSVAAASLGLWLASVL
jgi:CrcB protein